MIKICHISDTHGTYFKDLEPGDLLIHSGDGLLFGELYEVKSLAYWFKKQDYKWKIFVPGNHDSVFEYMYIPCKEIMNEAGVIVLKNESICDPGIIGLPLKIWGSPYTKEFMDWAFMLPEERLASIWDTIPRDTDIIVTHGPPYGILDNCSNPYNIVKNHAGSTSLLRRVMEIKPKYHLFGHIHVAKGARMVDGINFINSSVVNNELNSIAEPNYFYF